MNDRCGSDTERKGVLPLHECPGQQQRDSFTRSVRSTALLRHSERFYQEDGLGRKWSQSRYDSKNSASHSLATNKDKLRFEMCWSALSECAVEDHKPF